MSLKNVENRSEKLTEENGRFWPLRIRCNVNATIVKGHVNRKEKLLNGWFLSLKNL